MGVVWRIVRAAALMLIALAVIRQCRKPRWFLGRLFARSMNRTHRALTDWGLGHFALAKDSAILDVGCGGGATIADLALRAPQGTIFGIDYSAASVAVARQTNAALIELGRVDIRQGSVSALPFGDATFDAVTAIETHYYWPDLATDLSEIRRVLKPEGRLVIIAEAYRRKGGIAEVVAMRLLGSRLLTADQHRDAFLSAGFNEVAVFENRKGWLAVTGKRA